MAGVMDDPLSLFSPIVEFFMVFMQRIETELEFQLEELIGLPENERFLGCVRAIILVMEAWDETGADLSVNYLIYILGVINLDGDFPFNDGCLLACI